MATDYAEADRALREQDFEIKQAIYRTCADDLLQDNLQRIDRLWLYLWAKTSPDFCSLMGLEVEMIDMDDEAYREANQWRSETIWEVGE